MGALLTQAVANQLRQVLGFQDPHPSPPTLIQQVLNPPGPSRPTWMAPVMERQQLLATNTPEARQALQQDALRMAMAFGGADITKEQRARWEAENEAYRKGRDPEGKDPRPGSYPPGTRVFVRPYGARLQREESAFHKSKGIADKFGEEGVIVEPKGETSGYTAPTYWMKPPTPEHAAVKMDKDPYWLWRRHDSLEVLPPLETFKDGDMVEYIGDPSGAIRYHGSVTKAPRGHAPSPGPEYVWVDVFGTPRGVGEQGVKRYQYNFGAWFLRRDLKKVGK